MLLELVLMAVLTDEPRIITCEVGTYTNEITCRDDNALITGPLLATWKAEWELVAPLQNGLPNSDAPLGHSPLKPGQKVALLVEDDGLTPLPTCDVRVWRNLKAYRKGREGVLVPMGLYTSTDSDCQAEKKSLFKGVLL